MRRVLVVALIVAGLAVWRFHLWPRRATTEPQPPKTTPAPVAMAVDAAKSIDAAPASVALLAIPGSDVIADMLVVDGRLVWTDSAGSIWTMSTSGRDARELANQHDGPGFPMYHPLALHRGKVYAGRTGKIATVALPEGPVTPLEWDLGDDGAYELVSDGTALYGAMFSGKSLAKFDDDGKRTNLATVREGVIVAAGSAVYSANFDSGVVAQLAPVARKLASGIPHPTGFAADEHAVYVWSQLDNGLRKIELPSGAAHLLWKPDFLASDALLPDGDWLYADAQTEQGTSSLVRIAKDGSQLQVLVGELSHSGPIASDADAVYAAGAVGGGFVRVEKAHVQPIRVVKPATSLR